MKLPKITDLVKSEAKFIRYRDGELWYRVQYAQVLEQEIGLGLMGGVAIYNFDFPIPISDTGGGEFLPVDKGLIFMRWIRKHLEHLESAVAGE